MKLEYGSHYKNSEKNLKRRMQEQKNLELIKVHIKACSTYTEFESNPITKMYKYEALKHELNGFYSLNLCKNGGTIRLIVSINKENNSICLEYISKDHYDDFKTRL